MKLFFFSLLLLPNSLFAQSLDKKIERCENGVSQECMSVGLAYFKGLYQGKSIAENDKKSLYYFNKSCDAGIGEGCHNLAIIFKILKDKDQFLVNLSKACQQYDYRRSCRFMAKLYHFGRTKDKFGFEIKKDKQKTIVYVKRACDLGAVEECYLLDKLSPEYFDKLPENSTQIFEATLLQDKLLLPERNSVSMETILKSYNHFEAENDFYKVKTKMYIFGHQVYYMGVMGVDLLPGPNAVVDGNPVQVAEDITKQYGVKFTYKAEDNTYVSPKKNDIVIIIRPYRWQETSYIIGVYVGP